MSRARHKSGDASASPGWRTGSDGKNYPAKVERKPVASPPPLNRKVNALLGRLGDAVDDAIAGITAFRFAHPELDQDGRDGLHHYVTANQLLDVAQKIDGR